MPATLNLLPRKIFEITLEDGTIIKGKFGTWALKRFCDKYDLTLEQAEEKLISLSFVDYILCAVECVCREAGASFSYNDVHASDWIDQLGGVTSENFGKLARHTQSTSNAEAGTEEKKTLEAV